MKTSLHSLLNLIANRRSLSGDRFLWIIVIVLYVLHLPFGISHASASVQSGTNSDANALLVTLAECPASISFGETIHCAITAAGEIDAYTFTASAGDKVLVRMSKTASGSLWPGVTVNAPGGAKLCEQASINSTTAEIPSCTLTGSGIFTILAHDGNSGLPTGEYHLYLQRLNNPGNTVSISFGQTLPASISTSAEMDTYTFSATVGDKVLVRMSKTILANFWPGVRVYSPDGTKLCEQNSTSSTTVEIASCALSSTGTYTILAYESSYGMYADGYHLFIQRLNNPGDPVSITFAQTLPASIATPTEMDTYTFLASAGDKVLVRMSQSSGNVWPGIRIYGPDGTKLCDKHSSDSVTAEIASCSLPDSGTYTILGYDDLYGMYTGDYHIYIQRLNDPGDPIPISFGQTLSGSIITSAEMDTYTFLASAGDKVLVRMSKSSGDVWPGIRIYAPDGVKLCEKKSSDSITAEIASCSLSSTGTYTILVFDDLFGMDAGNYQIFLELLIYPRGYLPLILR
jgi:hypothetical protein